jgi:hypothetical protein
MSDEACTRPFTEAAHRCGCGWLAVSTHGLTAGGTQSDRPGDSSMGSPRGVHDKSHEAAHTLMGNQ